jgi:hypothetical protein
VIELSGWENFYVIIGSSAGALIGLQFVVMTLLSEMPALRDVERAGSAFATPTVIHFGSALLLSALLSAPWHGVIGPAVLCGVLGAVGVAYSLLVFRRMRTQTAYKPVLEDWLFHAWLPIVAYTTLAGSGYAAYAHGAGALFGVAAAALLLLFIGIHNAWDAVVYHVIAITRNKAGSEQGR